MIKILDNVRSIPPSLKKKTIRELIMSKTDSNDHLSEIIKIVERCLEFVPKNRKSAHSLLHEMTKKYDQTMKEKRTYFKSNSGRDFTKYSKLFNPILNGPMLSTLESKIKLPELYQRLAEREKNSVSPIPTFPLTKAIVEADSPDSNDEIIEQLNWNNNNMSDNFQEDYQTKNEMFSETDVSEADLEDADMNIAENPNRFFSSVQGKKFETGVQNFEELRKTCDRSFIHNSLYIGHDIGINVELIDVPNRIDSDYSD